MMLHMKPDQDWPNGLRDIQVRKCKIFVISSDQKQLRKVEASFSPLYV